MTRINQMEAVAAPQIVEHLQSVGRRAFTRAEFQKMHDAGMIRPDEHTELVGGTIFVSTHDGLMPRRFSSREYHHLAELDILKPNERTELIDGEIYLHMAPISSEHGGTVTLLNYRLGRIVPDDVLVSVQSPIQLPDSEPEPDVALLRFRDDFYIKSHPTPDDVVLVIEVSLSTLQYDRREKVNLYAVGMIPEVWIIDIEGRILYQYLTPANGTYTVINTLTDTEQVTSAALGGKQIAVAELLGSR
jgi:Uma2 family endonuclease